MTRSSGGQAGLKVILLVRQILLHSGSLGHDKERTNGKQRIEVLVGRTVSVI